MSDSGRIIRLNRVLGGNHHKALIVAFDHALVLGSIPGTENPLGQLRRFVSGGADAILLNLGLLENSVRSLASAPLPGIIARIDWTTVWGAPGHPDGGELRGCLLARPEGALRQGADAVLTYLVVGTGDTDFEAKEVERNAEVARECERIGMPLIVETLARGKKVTAPSDPTWLNLHTRMAVELGASMIKTDYAGDPDSMRRIVDNCPVPIVVLGGSRCSSEEQALEVIRGAIAGGAAGVLFGRNVFQSADIGSFLGRARAALDGPQVTP